jgi:hypothetical protein
VEAHHQPWDRLPEETTRAFEAFRVYLRLGASRSLAATQAAIRGERAGNARARSGTYGVWSRRFRWVARADAYDRHLTREHQRACEDAVRRQAEAEAERWAAFARQVPEAIRTHFQSIVARLNELWAREGSKRKPKCSEIIEVQLLLKGFMPLFDRALAFAAPALLPGVPQQPGPDPGDISDQEALIWNRAMAEARERGEL